MLMIDTCVKSQKNTGRVCNLCHRYLFAHAETATSTARRETVKFKFNKTLSIDAKLKTVRITIFFLLFLIVIFLSLAGRCFYLQYFKSPHYSSVSIRQQLQKPRRGVILDRNGSLLAASNNTQTVFAEPRIIKDPKKVSNKLGPILAMEPQTICRLITETKNPGYVKIKVDADANECSAAAEIYGIGIESSWNRNYPMGSLAGNVVGFTSSDDRGLGSIELKYNEKLKGIPGRNIFLADAYRRPIRLKEQQSVLEDGVGIILTLDAAIQQFAREELLKQYEKFEAESAVAIVANPKSGAILAMVSLPDFDPANIRPEDANNLCNRILTDQFEPGSILKPIAAAIAIDSGVLDKNEKIYCENGVYRGKGFGRIGEYRNKGYGNLNIREILIHSSNIGMAKIGQKLGAKKLYEGLKHFGFGRKTGIDLPGEAPGLLRTPDKWTGYSVTRIPYGHELSVTAIQMLKAFCILANGGRFVQPFLVNAMVDNEGKIVKLKRPSRQLGIVISPEVASWVITDALAAVVNDAGGTGRRAKLKKWKVFGKTGTANIAKSNAKGYSEDDYTASFIGGAPTEDPAIVVLVSIRKPNKKIGYTGGTVASPAVGKIIEKTLTYLEKK